MTFNTWRRGRGVDCVGVKLALMLLLCISFFLEVKELKSDYTIRVNAQVTSAQENLNTVKSSTTELMKKVTILAFTTV